MLARLEDDKNVYKYFFFSIFEYRRRHSEVTTVAAGHNACERASESVNHCELARTAVTSRAETSNLVSLSERRRAAGCQ